MGDKRHDSGRVFILVATGIIVIAWYGLLLSEIQFFHRLLIYPFIALVVILLAIMARRLFRKVVFSRADVMALVLCLVIGILIITFATDNLYGGMDPGVYANSAVYLAKRHNTVVEGDIRLPGLAVRDGTLEVYFQKGYIAWLAIHYVLFGITGINANNFLLIVISLMSLYYLGKYLLDEAAGVAALLMLGTTYPFIWFSRGTYSEIFSMALILFGLLCVTAAFREENRKFLIPSVLSFGLFLHVRIEAIALFLMFLAVLVYRYFIKKQRWLFSPYIFILLLMVIGHYIIYSFNVDPVYFYRRIDNVGLEHAGIVGGLKDSILHLFTLNKPGTLEYHLTDFVFRVLSVYGLSWAILAVPVVVVMGVFKRTRDLIPFVRNGYYTVLLITIPTFVYLISPFIDLYMPWFLRRYTFCIIPVAYLTGALLIFSILKGKRRKYAAALILGVLAINIFIASPVIFHREFAGMFEKVGKIAEKFDGDDVVFVDRFCVGTYKIADPMYYAFGVHASWVGGPKDWCSIRDIDFEGLRGRDVYIIANTGNPWLIKFFPKESLEFYFEEELSYRELPRTINVYAMMAGKTDVGEIEYEKIKKMMELPTYINERKFKIVAYKVNLEVLSMTGLK